MNSRFLLRLEWVWGRIVLNLLMNSYNSTLESPFEVFLFLSKQHIWDQQHPLFINKGNFYNQNYICRRENCTTFMFPFPLSLFLFHFPLSPSFLFPCPLFLCCFFKFCVSPGFNPLIKLIFYRLPPQQLPPVILWIVMIWEGYVVLCMYLFKGSPHLFLPPLLSKQWATRRIQKGIKEQQNEIQKTPSSNGKLVLMNSELCSKHWF